MKKRNNKKKGSQSNFSKLSVFQNNKYKLEVVSLKDSKTAEPIIVELNITKF